MAAVSPTFEDLPGGAARLLHPPFRSEVFAAGDVLVEQGDRRRSMHFLGAGGVEVVVAGRQVATLQPGSVFGEIALFTETVRTATVRALVPTTTYVLDPERFDHLRRVDPPLAGWIEGRALVQLLGRLREITEQARAEIRQDDRLTVVDIHESEGHRAFLPDPVLDAALTAAFPSASPWMRTRMALHARIQTYAADANLAPAGLRDFRYGILLSGQLAATAPLLLDGALPITTLQPGEALGFLPSIDGQPRPLHLVTTVGSTVLWLAPSFAQDHLADTSLGPVLRRPLLHSLARAITRANAAARRNEPAVRELAAIREPPEPPQLPGPTFRPLTIEAPLGFAERDGSWDAWFEMGTTLP